MSFDMQKTEQEVRTATDTEMASFCKREQVRSGWSTKQHAQFCTEQIMDLVESGLAPDETKFRLWTFLNLTANYSSFRQKYEGDDASGKPLRPSGPKKGGADLASDYMARFAR